MSCGFNCCRWTMWLFVLLGNRVFPSGYVLKRSRNKERTEAWKRVQERPGCFSILR